MRTYQGIGIFTATGKPAVKGNFTLQFEDNGKYSMSLIPEDQAVALSYAKLPFIMGKFTGNSVNPYLDLNIETVYLSSMTMDMKAGQQLELKFSFQIFSPITALFIPTKQDDAVEVRRGLTNLLFWGTEIVQQGEHYVRGKTTWQLDGKDISLEQVNNFDEVKNHLNEFKDVAVTCELKTNGIFKEIDAYREIFDNLQNLFSLAKANFVTPIYEDVYFNGQLSATTLFPLKTYSFSSRPSLIDSSINGAHEFKEYIDTTYQNFARLKDHMGLGYFIEFFNTSKMYSPMEVEYLLSTTAFECLENYFKDWQRLQPIRLDLKGKITRMCNYFGFTATNAELDAYRECRNSITHTGKFPTSRPNHRADTMMLRNLIDRFVLTILGYRNKPYLNAITNRTDIVPLELLNKK